MNWINDGHAIEMTFEDQHIGALFVCPHDGRDLSGLTGDGVPVCRWQFDDAGTRLVDQPALAYCVIQDWVRDSGVEEVIDTEGAEVKPTVLPMPVAYAWDGNWYVLRPSGLLDLESALAGQEAAS